MKGGSRATIKVGIDVGGTFTKAVALDGRQRLLVKATVPTTYRAEEGVARGVIEALRLLLKEGGLEPAQIALVAFSTTQAVNALLEGDVAPVGIVGLGSAMDLKMVRKLTRLGRMELAEGRWLETFQEVLSLEDMSEDQIEGALQRLLAKGAKAIVVSQAFGVDDHTNELKVLDKTRAMGLPSIAGHEISGAYGLEIRTVTATINASILPRMMRVADFVEKSVKELGIYAPILVMKGDGGLATLELLRNRPILTAFSGPAATVAGALLYGRIAQGIIIEVGGTSTNMSVIRYGRPSMKYVKVIDHPTCIRSLDVRVLGIAGGSMVRVRGRRIVDVGPRSAHAAGFEYACFSYGVNWDEMEVKALAPSPGDPEDYVCLEGCGKRLAITCTCAANALGLIPKGDYAHGNSEGAKEALKLLGSRLGISYEQAARRILELAVAKLLSVLKELIKEYHLSKEGTILVGCGGGASVLIPLLASKAGLQYDILENAEVISSIGVASAAIREEMEKSVAEGPDRAVMADLLEEVRRRVIEQGCSPESVEVSTYYIPERGVVRAVAQGSLELSSDLPKGASDPKLLMESIKGALKLNFETLEPKAELQHYYIFQGRVLKERLHGLYKASEPIIIVADRFGRIKLVLPKAQLLLSSPDQLLEELRRAIGSGGRRVAPQVYLVKDSALVDLSAIITPEGLYRELERQLRGEEGRVVALLRLK